MKRLLVALLALPLLWVGPAVAVAKPKPPPIPVNCRITDQDHYTVDVTKGVGFADYLVGEGCNHKGDLMVVGGKFFVNGDVVSSALNTCRQTVACRVKDVVSFKTPASLRLGSHFTIVLPKGYAFNKVPPGCDVASRTVTCIRTTSLVTVP